MTQCSLRLYYSEKNLRERWHSERVSKIAFLILGLSQNLKNYTKLKWFMCFSIVTRYTMTLHEIMLHNLVFVVLKCLWNFTQRILQFLSFWYNFAKKNITEFTVYKYIYAFEKKTFIFQNQSNVCGKHRRTI